MKDSSPVTRLDRTHPEKTVTVAPITRQDLVLPGDFRLSLQEIVQESGLSFQVIDSAGRRASILPPGKTVIGASASHGRSVSVPLPLGGVGELSILNADPGDPGQGAWLRAVSCLIRSTVRLGAEVENMAAEIARVYEELSLLYSSSATLSAAESVNDACERVLQLAIRHMPSRGAAIYVREGETAQFTRSAVRGPEDIWARAVSEQASPAMRSLFAGQTLLQESADIETLQGAGVAGGESGSLLCAPFFLETGSVSGILGWLTLYDRAGRAPFFSSDVKLAEALCAQAAVAIVNARLVESRQALLMGTIRSLASAVDAKDRYTHGHSRRVTDYGLMIGQEIGCPPVQLQALELAGLMHDVGKIGVPDYVLAKPGALNEEEWQYMRRHPLIGAAIVEKVPGLHPFVGHGIRSHHEKFDGSGYPDALARDAIPLAGRILSVADCFDAMTSDRPYRQSMGPEDAIRRMTAGCGTQFDPVILGAFLNMWTAGILRLLAA